MIMMQYTVMIMMQYTVMIMMEYINNSLFALPFF
jgi:hypothetical protein